MLAEPGNDSTIGRRLLQRIELTEHQPERRTTYILDDLFFRFRPVDLLMPPTLEQLRERYGSRYKWLVLLTVMIGTVASILSSTIVNVAVPDLSRYFVLD